MIIVSRSMKIILSTILLLFCATGLFAQMSDEQIKNYVKQEYTKGTSQQEIAINLAKRGVTKQQLERIKKNQEVEQTSTTGSNNSQTKQNSLQNQSSSSKIDRNLNLKKKDVSDNTETVEIATDYESTDDFINFTDDLELFKQSIDSTEVFGRNIFNTKNLTFNPNVNIPTPVDYRLGPGDEVNIDIWGASQTSVREFISPEGSILVERLGPIFLNGMTVREANDFVQRKFADIYAGIDSEGASQIKLTLGQIRTIQINVMGEAVTPGTYSISSLSSVFHALYSAGGVNKIGSLRTVKLYRNNKLLRTLDIYKYILDGQLNDDIRMTDGDVVIVPPYVSLVRISGNVKRPMLYEMTSKETVSDLLKYSGGFTGDAYTKKVNIVRSTGGEKKIFTIDEENFKSFTLFDKDIVTVSPGIDRFENRVEIKGAVYREGFYEIGNNINTIKQLIVAADGLRGDAFLNRAILTREKEDYTSEVISVDLRNLFYGSVNDIVLRKNDVLYIPAISDLKEIGDIIIQGEIARPGEYKYADNITLEDLIIQAGGLLESASIVKVDVARRIIDTHSQTVERTLSETFSFGLKDGFIVDAEKGFVLKPYDQIYVRRSPGYREQQNVYLEGEVLFPGTYALNRKTERISDIVKRAGNLTPDAYSKGARLIRKTSDEEKFRSQMALKMASNVSKDSISVKTLELSTSYNVGIELDKALLNPGSDYDLVLREGDKIIIPEYDNTVKINGAVMYPNTVVYRKGEKLSYYINQAGGYADNAKKNKSFVIYMNGTVSKIKGSDKDAIRPGSEIIVPTKEQLQRLTLPQIISLGTSITSMASLIGVLINSMK